jgi:hypothetical protein
MCVKPGVRRKVPAGVSLCSFEIQIAHKKDESLEKEGAGAIREQQQRSSLFGLHRKAAAAPHRAPLKTRASPLYNQRSRRASSTCNSVWT